MKYIIITLLCTCLALSAQAQAVKLSWQLVQGNKDNRFGIWPKHDFQPCSNHCPYEFTPF